jgi:hypothetical protein
MSDLPRVRRYVCWLLLLLLLRTRHVGQAGRVRGSLQRDVGLLSGLCDFARFRVIVSARCNDRITVFGALGHAPVELLGR